MRELRGLGLIAAGLLLAACSKSSEDRGLRYMPDMYESPAKKSQEAFVIAPTYDEDGNLIEKGHEIPAMAPPVPGTVPRDFVPYDLPNTEAGLAEARELVNPLTPTREVLVRGRERFDIYCATCHGKDGDPTHSAVTAPGRTAGVNGVLALVGDRVADMPDGEIFHIITNGRNRMPSYGAQLLPEDRWAVIHYLRALDEAVRASGRELERLELETRGLEREFRPLPEPRPEYELERWPSNIQREGAQ